MGFSQSQSPNPSNGFVAILLYQLMLSSRRQYTEKIRLWDLRKNVPGAVMRSACSKSYENPQGLSFIYKDRRITRKAIRRYKHRHRSSGTVPGNPKCEYNPWLLMSAGSDSIGAATSTDLIRKSDSECVPSSKENAMPEINRALTPSASLRKENGDLSDNVRVYVPADLEPVQIDTADQNLESLDILAGSFEKGPKTVTPELAEKQECLQNKDLRGDQAALFISPISWYTSLGQEYGPACLEKLSSRPDITTGQKELDVVFKAYLPQQGDILDGKRSLLVNLSRHSENQLL